MSEVRLQNRVFPLSTDPQLRAFKMALAERIDATRRREQWAKEERRRLLKDRSLADLSRADLERYFSVELSPKKKERRALAAMDRLVTLALAERDPACKRIDLQQTAEIAEALANLERHPLPAHVDSVTVPIVFWRYWHHAIGRGQEPASNLMTHSPDADLSRIDPISSTFWSRPRSLATQDLRTGFDRPQAPAYGQLLWTYHGPKAGYGTSPGFELHSSSLGTIKAKFAETHSEPFAARIFYALGFQVEPTDGVAQLYVRYDRRILREFNLRRELATHITTFLIPSHTIRIQRYDDPFAYFSAAIMKDGQHLSGSELKRALFRDSGLQRPEDWPQNFNPDVEAKIAYLVTVPANVHSDPNRRLGIGPWDFEGLGHADLRELRGAALVAGWLGWFDCRFLNTRLELSEGSGGVSLRHAITDLGSCLGKADGLTARTCERPEQFAWSFTQPPRTLGPGQMTVPFRITGYEPIQDPEAFRRMTLEDARWMARLIGALSEHQIHDALLAAGFEPAQLNLYLDKLISRRDHMIADLGLAKEIPLLRSRQDKGGQ